MIDSTLLETVKNHLKDISKIDVFLHDTTKDQEFKKFFKTITDLNKNFKITETDLPRNPSIKFQNGNNAITFAGIPTGHEFTSLILGILHLSGKTKKIPENLISKIKNLPKQNFEIYYSLTCQNCPDVVQAFNTIASLNQNISVTSIEGSSFPEEISTKNILSVPSVWKNGELFLSGRHTLEEILEKLNPSSLQEKENDSTLYDTIVIGAGPAGIAASLYASRKGLSVALLGKIGGQVTETLGIENIPGIPYTEGPELTKDYKKHLQKYPIILKENHFALSLEKEKDIFKITTTHGHLTTKTIILAPGSKWKSLNVPGEETFKTKGIAYCPHCDGPLFKDKSVAVIGGGNSGIEAALDLSHITKHVTVLEYSNTFKADKILLEKAQKQNNITLLSSVKTLSFEGQNTLEKIIYENLETQTKENLFVDGAFIQIGLIPQTDWIPKNIEKNKFGEIVITDKQETSIKGIFACGDASESQYKQISIASGSGAIAALSAYEYLTLSK